MPRSYKLKELFRRERPRERLVNKGAPALTNSELLAIILRSGGKKSSVLDLSNDILIKFGGLVGLVSADFHELLRIKDLGVAKATSIMALSELSIRISQEKVGERKQIVSPNDVFKIIKKEFFGKSTEHLYLLTLDTRRKLISKDLISVGTLNETLVHSREIYRVAVSKNASSIILAHNHPSGDLTPSDEDIDVTKRVAAAGEIIGISLIDHVIVSDSDFVSIKARVNYLGGLVGGKKLFKDAVIAKFKETPIFKESVRRFS